MADEKTLKKRNGNGSVAQQQGAQELADRPVLTPAVDIHENEHEYLLVADVPGVSAGSVSIRYDRGELNLQATRKLDDTEVDYRRSFRVPDVIDPAKIEAKLDHGVLTVHLRKAEDVKPRKIEVKTA
jgi:HSP20 family molecular chaperone IbpA